jgi:hypothetical protein
MCEGYIMKQCCGSRNQSYVKIRLRGISFTIFATTTLPPAFFLEKFERSFIYLHS